MNFMGFFTAIAPLVGLVGLWVALKLFNSVKNESPGDAKMQEIALAIREGAMAFLNREARILAVFEGVVFVLLGLALDWSTAIAFLIGAGASMSAEFCSSSSATLRSMHM